MAEVHGFRVFSLLKREYPVDFATAIDDVCYAASAWSAALLGPPQQSDMRVDIFQLEVDTEVDREVDRSTSVPKSELDSLWDLIETVNLETMRFKIELYQLYPMHGESTIVHDATQATYLLDRLDALEVRARILFPLEARLREEWDRWVTFAQPYVELHQTEMGYV